MYKFLIQYVWMSYIQKTNKKPMKIGKKHKINLYYPTPLLPCKPLIS